MLKPVKKTFYEKTTNTKICCNKTNEDLSIIDLNIKTFKEESSELTKKLLNYKESLLPQYKIEIDGKVFYLTKKIYEQNGDIIAYSEINGKYELILFRFSKSGGKWMCSPGIIEKKDGEYSSFIYSKGIKWGLSYENGTVLDSRLQIILNKILVGNEYIGLSVFYKLGLTEDYFENIIKKEVEIKELYEDASKTSLVSFKNGFSIEGKHYLLNYNNFIKLINLIPLKNLNLSFSKKTLGTKKHNYLGNIIYTIVDGILDGEDIQVVFVYTKEEKNLVWIENIYYKDIPISSLGIPSKIINGGFITLKPIEYEQQLSKQLLEYLKINNLYKKYGEYIDIRIFLQENPLVRQFKQYFS